MTTQMEMSFVERPEHYDDYWMTWWEWVDLNVGLFETTYDLPRAMQMARGFCRLSEEPDEDGHMYGG